MKTIFYLVAVMGAWLALFMFFTSCSTAERMPQGYDDCWYDRHGVMLCPDPGAMNE